MENTISLQEVGIVLNKSIIDYINNFDFGISNYLEKKESYRNLTDYITKVFYASFENNLLIRYGFCSKCEQLFDIYVHFYGAEIKDNKLCFNVTITSEQEETQEIHQEIEKVFEIDIKKDKNITRVKDTILLQKSDIVLNKSIIDYINNFDFKVNNYFKEKDNYESCTEYITKVFYASFEYNLPVRYCYCPKYMKLVEIYVRFYDAKIKDDKLCFTVEIKSTLKETKELYQIISKSFQIDTRKDIENKN